MHSLARATSAQTLDVLRGFVAGEPRLGTEADSMCGVIPELYIEPSDAAELSRLLNYANQAGLLVAPRGGGTKLDWGATPRAIDLMVSTARMNRILEHAPGDMTVAVEAGVTIAELQRSLLQHRQQLALDPLWPEHATVGGVIASNDSGPLRLRYGSLRDLIIGITVVLSDGTVAKSGGKVVKNVAGYDLPKLMTGALGTLGIITSAVFRLHPLPAETRTLTFPFVTRETANEFILSVADSIAVPTGLQMRTGSDGHIAVDVRVEGISAGVSAQAELIGNLAGKTGTSEPTEDPWLARERLWKDSDSATIFKLSMLPSQLSGVAEFVREALSENADWALVMNSTGLSWLRVDATECAQIAEFTAGLREFLMPQEGSAVLLKAPLSVRQQVDVWGNVGSSLALMKRLKEQFDPRGVLNRGRFVGGI